ncbi:MAG: type IV toxin-antitoxin system AbiEi family antitoxin domain-containing protein [Thermoleophilaceae bacterium]
MAVKGGSAERVIGRLASRSHGVVKRRELLRSGISRNEIEHRLETGALIREFRGVYRVGHRAPSVEARYLAAVFACGEGALLCGRAAGYLQQLIQGGPPIPEVVAPVKRRRRGVVTHRVHRVEDGTRLAGIPITTVPRTLVDLAKHLGDEELARACHEAGVRYGTTPRHVEAVLERRPNAPGAAKLRRICSGDSRVILSRLEKQFLRRLREAALPLPKTNRPAGGYYVDCRWPDHELTVELDSYRFHNSRHAWEQDHRRERAATSSAATTGPTCSRSRSPCWLSSGPC